MTTVAVRLPDELLAALDGLVEAGRYGSRSDAIRAALDALLAAHDQAAIDRTIVEGYRRTPQSDDEVAIATVATRALIADEPW